jgi:hypothetical protein
MVKTLFLGFFKIFLKNFTKYMVPKESYWNEENLLIIRFGLAFKIKTFNPYVHFSFLTRVCIFQVCLKFHISNSNYFTKILKIYIKMKMTLEIFLEKKLKTYQKI